MFLLDSSFEDPPVKDQDHCHILTGIFKIASDSKLRKILSKGPEYREPLNADLKQAMEDMTNCIDDFILAWCQRKDVTSAAQQPWKIKLRQLIDGRVIVIKSRSANIQKIMFLEKNAILSIH